ncbi:ATP-binding protein [Clostridium sp. CTA-19]
MTSIKTRISGGYLVSIIITVILVEVISIFAIRSFYYGGLEESLVNQIGISTNFYNTYFYNDTVKSNISNDIDLYWENADAKAEIIDKKGDILMDSQGQNRGKITVTNEFKDLVNGKIKFFKEKSSLNNEPILSVYMPLYYNGEVDGVLRFTSSTVDVDRNILKVSQYAIMAGFIIIILSSFVSLVISNSVAKPLKIISQGAEKMAEGNFNDKIPKYSDDEIGKLADTLNYMSEEILKNEKLKNEFIASVSHELRTPLTSIKGWSIVLKSSEFEDEEEIKEGLDIIEQEVDRLTYLVEDLLDFSKLLSGNMTLKKENVDIDDLLRGICKQLTPRANNEGLILTLKIDGELPSVSVDINKAKQVFINIIDNAIKFTNDGGRILICVNADEDYINISVKDNGGGIALEDLEKVKEKFFKGKDSKSSNGIGLSVCDEIIKLHDGELLILSEVNVGTEVIVKLPLLL